MAGRQNSLAPFFVLFRPKTLYYIGPPWSFPFEAENFELRPRLARHSLDNRVL